MLATDPSKMESVKMVKRIDDFIAARRSSRCGSVAYSLPYVPFGECIYSRILEVV